MDPRRSIALKRPQLREEQVFGAAVGEWRLADMAKARATAEAQTEASMLMALWCLLVRGEVLGEADGATCAEHSLIATHGSFLRGRGVARR